MIRLAPSILAADFTMLGQEVKEVEQAGCEYLHLDVMDGKFVPNISFGPSVIKSLRNKCDMVFDVHLMIEEPERYFPEFVKAGADIITFHVEATKDMKKAVSMLKELGVKASLSIKPDTPVEVIKDILPEVDMVLIMTVYPGFGGQSLIPETIQKIRELKDMITKAGLSTDIEVDGGISPDNVKELIEAGANVIVAGTSVFSGNKRENVMNFKEVFADASGRNEAR